VTDAFTKNRVMKFAGAKTIWHIRHPVVFQKNSIDDF